MNSNLLTRPVYSHRLSHFDRHKIRQRHVKPVDAQIQLVDYGRYLPRELLPPAGCGLFLLWPVTSLATIGRLLQRDVTERPDWLLSAAATGV